MMSHRWTTLSDWLILQSIAGIDIQKGTQSRHISTKYLGLFLDHTWFKNDNHRKVRIRLVFLYQYLHRAYTVMLNTFIIFAWVKMVFSLILFRFVLKIWNPINHANLKLFTEAQIPFGWQNLKRLFCNMTRLINYT